MLNPSKKKTGKKPRALCFTTIWRFNLKAFIDSQHAGASAGRPALAVALFSVCLLFFFFLPASFVFFFFF